MNFLKKHTKLQLFILLLAVFIIPINSYAYSKYIVPGGETIGIEVNSDGVLVVGFYKVGNEYIGKEAGFEVGDLITEINDVEVNSIEQMAEIVKDEAMSNELDVTIERNGKSSDLSLKMVCSEDDVCKTGLYVKDQITGVGTLTYIDPNSKIFGALGHEIIEKTTGEKFEIKDGEIFEANVTGTTRSDGGTPGEKNATYDRNTVFGDIFYNKESGIFGNYQYSFDTDKLVEVANPEDIELGAAKMLTVLEGSTINEYEINILNIDDSSDTKNILFEITDEELLSKTGGVIQGMSGSPILQNNKIIGAVTHVIVNEPKKGYGIFITTMLKEGEKRANE